MIRRPADQPSGWLAGQGSPFENPILQQPILLVSGATRTVESLSPHPRLGQFVTPRTGNDIARIARAGHAWAADNDALAGIDPDAYLTMLVQIAAADRTHLRFVAVPDSVTMTEAGPVGDWPGTLVLFASWRRALTRRALPAAIVLQDGATIDTVPWAHIQAVFVGGSTSWKEGDAAQIIMREAIARGCWVHVGRINTLRRYWAMHGLFHSYDGTGFSKWPSNIRWMLDNTSQQRFLTEC